jgi:hypothetical protein
MSVSMRFLLGWAFKLGFLGMAWLAVTGNLQLRLPESILGYEMPPQLRQWAERAARVGDLENGTESGLRRISDSLK